MEGQRVVFLVVILLFILFTPDQTPRRRALFGNNHLRVQRQQDFDVLANSTYGDFDGQEKLLNLTGFRDDDGYQWDLLEKAQERSRSQWANSLQTTGDDLPFYKTVTGEVRGKWLRSELSSTNHPHLNLTHLDPRKEYVSHIWNRNITEHDGEIGLTLHDDDAVPDGPREIAAEMSLYSDSSPGNGWQAQLRGVHFPGGSAILTTASTKFDALPALPHFALNAQQFEGAQEVMNKTVTKLWKRRMLVDPEMIGLAHCEIIIFLQPRPIVAAGSAAFVLQVEAELTSPEGAPIGDPPPLSYSAVVLSPDCGYVLESDNLFGPKVEAFSRLAGRLLVAFIIILGLQIFLLKRQMEKASTPSTRSRISYQGIVIAALGDGLILLAMIALLMIEEAGFLVVAATTYLACIHVAFLEVKFVFDIWTVQVGEPMLAEHERQRRANTPAAPPPQPTTELPLPATAPRITDGAVPLLITTSDGELDQPPSPRASFAAIYSRFYFTLVILMFISLWATSWPRAIRATYTNTLVLFYFSLWTPQIYRNAMRNCRKALAWEYVLGSTVLRTLPVTYWYLTPRNILAIEPSPTSAGFLLLWIWTQVFIMATQQFLGPRLFVKDAWCPPAYDYHPILRADNDDLEAGDSNSSGGIPVGLLTSASEPKDKDEITDQSRKLFDCAICMNEIDVPVLAKTDPPRSRNAPWLEQRNYMVTPCRHIFHTECLEGWMNLRLVCPVCREALPPL